MAPIRIVIVRTPRMLREILEETVSTEMDMVVVDREDATDDVVTAAVSLEADVVVCSDPPSVAELSRIFATRPRACVLTLGSAGDDVVLHELRPERVKLGGASPDVLVAAIREHAWAAGVRP